MLDVKFIAENTGFVKERLSLRNAAYDIDGIVKLDKKRKKILREAEGLKAERNAASDAIGLLMREKKTEEAERQKTVVKELNERIKKLDAALAKTEESLSALLYSVPNLPHKSVPRGADDKDNKVVRTYLKPAEFPFTPLPHWELGEKLGLFDFAAAAKITGSRFTVLRGAGAKLERALISFMLDTQIKAGYTEILPPFIVNRDSMTGTGQLPKFEEDMFALKNTDYYLIPTAEVPVTNLLRGEVVEEHTLPVKYTAYTACFRAEAGSAGRDTRGIIRQHQFDKIELVKFTTPENSYAEHEKLTRDAEKILKLLKLPYRVSLLCGGDMGFCSAKTYDIEVWMPSYGRYVEISSCSNFEDFQARRANIKYRPSDGGKARHLHTLNGSGLAVGRTMAAVIENYQNADGSITIPAALKKYFGTAPIK